MAQPSNSRPGHDFPKRPRTQKNANDIATAKVTQFGSPLIAPLWPLPSARTSFRSRSLAHGRNRAPPVLPALGLHGVFGTGGGVADGLLAGGARSISQDGRFTVASRIAGRLGRPGQIREFAIV